MRRLHIFLAILIVTLSGLLILAFVALYLATADPSYYGSNWISQMWGSYGGMGGMMGNSNGTAGGSNLWIIPAALITVSLAAIIGVAFYFFFPELRYIKGSSCTPQKTEPILSQVKTADVAAAVPLASSSASSKPTASNICDVLLKTMTPEDQKVLNVLLSHQGRYLQKYVVKEAGLSRLKTHRIIARFAQRGIVTVKEFGNTNEILLSNWVTMPN
jgi:uncharacterized membrane protein